jgi:hypothetical protein
LFRLDVDSSIWVDDDLLGTNEDTKVPKWLGDERVRTGIIAMLNKDRGLEEQERISVELEAMSRWLRETLSKMKVALASSTSSYIYHFDLMQRLLKFY